MGRVSTPEAVSLATGASFNCKWHLHTKQTFCFDTAGRDMQKNKTAHTVEAMADCDHIVLSL